MIYADQKQFNEIYEMIQEYKKILVLGCGVCTTVSMSGGEKEARELKMKLEMKDSSLSVTTATAKRQCDKEFIDEVGEQIKEADAVLSLGCGVGVQMVAEFAAPRPVFPGLNTSFIGSNEGEGVWLERCSLCGECILDKTGGICPHTICPKGLMNGPCGGMDNGKCEVNCENECAWVSIYNRLEQMGKLSNIEEPYAAKNKNKTRHSGPENVKRSID